MKKTIWLSAILMLISCTDPVAEWSKPDTITLGCENYQSIPLNNAVLYNNVWNKDSAKDYNWTQCLEQKPNSVKPVYGWSWDWPNKGRQIFSYPQIKFGSSPWDPLPKIDARFPVRLGDLATLVINHDLDIDSNGQFNVATTLWLVNSPNIGDAPNPSIIKAEVMIWTFATDKHMNPAGRKIGVIKQDDKNWSVWLNENWGDVSGQNNNKWINITFKAEESHLSNQFNIAALLDHDLLSELNLHDSYVADIELGTEIMRGKGLLWVNHFDVDMSRR